MGAARRRRQAAESRRQCEACRHLAWLKSEGVEMTEAALGEYLVEHPHYCIQDPGPQQARRYVVEQIQVEQGISEGIDRLFQMVGRHYETRNGFMEDLLREGLRVCFEAQQAALQKKAAESTVEKAKKAEEALRSRLVRLPHEVQ